jgi:hypothetical protein
MLIYRFSFQVSKRSRPQRQCIYINFPRNIYINDHTCRYIIMCSLLCHLHDDIISSSFYPRLRVWGFILPDPFIDSFYCQEAIPASLRRIRSDWTPLRLPPSVHSYKLSTCSVPNLSVHRNLLVKDFGLFRFYKHENRMTSK